MRAVIKNDEPEKASAIILDNKTLTELKKEVNDILLMTHETLNHEQFREIPQRLQLFIKQICALLNLLPVDADRLQRIIFSFFYSQTHFSKDKTN